MSRRQTARLIVVTLGQNCLSPGEGPATLIKLLSAADEVTALSRKANESPGLFEQRRTTAAVIVPTGRYSGILPG